MRTVLVVVAAILIVSAPVFAQGFVTTWGEAIPIEPLDQVNGVSSYLLETMANSPGSESSFDEPSWSPDGNTIVFTNHYAIWTVPAEGGAATFVCGITNTTDNAHLVLRHSSPVYSSDGAELYFSASMPFDNTYDSPSRVLNIDSETGEYDVVDWGWYVRVSPSGRYLCYHQSYLDDDLGEMVLSLKVLDTETGDTTILLDEVTRQYSGHCFMDDESGVIVVLQEEDSDEEQQYLYTIPLAGGDPELLELDEYHAHISVPTSVPNTTLVVFKTHFDENGMCLYAADMLTGAVHQLTPYPAGHQTSHPMPSPDGSKLCYSLWDPAEGYSLRIIDISSIAEQYYSIPTAVETDAPAVFPTVANYPNPFNPTTTISFTLPEAGFAELSVYNLAGQKVRELVAGEHAPGSHEVVWDGSDMNGMPVSSGVFFSRLSAGNTVVTDRMTLVK